MSVQERLDEISSSVRTPASGSSRDRALSALPRGVRAARAQEAGSADVGVARFARPCSSRIRMDGCMGRSFVAPGSTHSTRLLSLLVRASPPIKSGREGDRELLADLAVLVGHDVPGVRVGAGDAGDLDVVPRLLLDLADDGLGD